MKSALFLVLLMIPACGATTGNIQVVYSPYGAGMVVEVSGALDSARARAVLERQARVWARCGQYAVEVDAVTARVKRPADKDLPPTVTSTVAGKLTCATASLLPPRS